jgi:hypothetical protein
METLQPFGPRISTLTHADQIVDVLNRRQPSHDEYLVALRRFGTHLAPLVDGFKPFFPAYLSQRLRAFVDPWLDTGRNRDGSEQPDRRRVPAEAQHKVYAYLDSHQPKFRASNDPWGFSFVLDPITDDSVVKETVFAAVENNATRLFCALIASEWRVKVCKCRYLRCSRYFLLPKPPKPEAIRRHGMFCSAAHRRRASAEAHTRLRRSQSASRLVEWAANWLKNQRVGSNWQDDSDLKRRLAVFLSKRISETPHFPAGLDDIKSNWVTHHRTEIEQRRLEIKKVR